MRLKSAIIFAKSKQVSSVIGGFYYFKANHNDNHQDDGVCLKFCDFIASRTRE